MPTLYRRSRARGEPPVAEQHVGQVKAGANWQQPPPERFDKLSEREELIAHITTIIVVVVVLVALLNAALWLMDSLP